MAFSQSSLFPIPDDNCPSLSTATLFSCWQRGKTKQNKTTQPLSYIMCSLPPPGDSELKGPWYFYQCHSMSRTGNKNIFLVRLKYNTPLWSCFKKNQETKIFEKYFRWEIFIKIFHFVKNISKLFLAFQLTRHWTSAWLICFTLVVEGTEVITKGRARSCPMGQKSLQAGVKLEGCFQKGNRTEGQGKRE